MRPRLVIAGLCAALAAPCLTSPSAHAADGVTVTRFSTVQQRVGAGEFTRVYDPSAGEPQDWYINDHTFVRAADGTWHLFGITHPEPADPGDEDHFAHATAPSLAGPWTKQPFALSVDPAYGETHLWAPFVLRRGDTYYMYYAGGPDGSASGINLATSKDLFTWRRHPGGSLFFDGYDARDPHVVRVGRQWVMYYTATSAPTGGNHVVAYRTSRDLVNWSGRRIAYTDAATGTWGGPTESPFVQYRQGYWYLFIGPRGGYVGTDVLRSRDPFNFTVDGLVGHIASHAAEVVDDGGRWYVSAAGWGQGGVWLADLDWRQRVTVSGVRVRAPAYRATVQAAPATALTELSVPVGGGSWRNLLDSSGRGTAPYAGVGGWGATDRAGRAARVELSGKGREVVLSGVPLGDEPVTLDWRFHFRPSWFDTSLDWHVAAPPSAPVWEAAWSLDTTLPRVGDETGLDQDGDRPGFSRWTLAGDGQVSLAAAYRRGSAWSETNRWFSPADGLVAWQPLWSPGGLGWAPGDYAGGTWRVGVSARGDDRGLADALSAGVNAAAR